jgi:uncharacterized protein involved in outer membrane biogenesis
VRIVETLGSLSPARIVSALKNPVTRKVAWWAAGIIGLYAIVGFLVLPPVAKYVALKELPKALHREVSIASIRFNPFTLALRVTGFAVKEKESTDLFVGFDELLVDFQLASIFKRGPVLREIRLQAPKVKIVRNQDGSYNFSDLIEQPSPKPPEPAAKGALPRFSLNNIQIVDGQVDFDDQPAAARHEVRELNVAVPFLSDLPYAVDTYIEPSFHAVVDGSPVFLAGKTKPFEDSLESTIDIDINHLDLPRYLAYVPAKLRFKIPSGLLDTKLTASFMRQKDKAPALTLSGRVTLENLAVTELDDRPLLTLPLVAVRVDAAEVFARKFQVGYVLVQNPELQVRRDRAGKINLLSVAAEGEAKKGTSEKKDVATSDKRGAFSLELSELKVADATIRVSDEMPAKPFRTDIEALNLDISKFAYPQTTPAAVALDFRTSAGETFRQTGTVLMDPLSAEGTVELSNFRIPAYAPYYGPFILFDVKDGLFNLSTRYNVAKTPEGLNAKISGLQTSVSSLQLRKQGEHTDFVRIPETTVKNGELDLGKRTVVVEEFLTKNGAITVKREKDGSIDLTKLVAPPSPKAEETPRAEETRPWTFTVKKATVDRYAVSFADETPSEPVKIQAEPIQVVVENLSNQKESKAQASLRVTVNKKGTVAVDGSVGLNPLATDLRLDVQRLDLVPLQPYVTDKVKILVSSGELRLKGRLGVREVAGGPPQISFAGQTNLGNFVSLDRATSEDFLKWKSLFVGGIQANVNPLRLEINEVALSDFYSRLIVYPNGTLNLREMLAGGEAQPATGSAAGAGGGEGPAAAPAKKESASGPPAAAPASIAIGRVVLQGGNVNFTDLFIKPNYSANLTDLGGSVTGLSAQPGTTADVEILGRLNRSAPLEIKGKVNPLAANPYLDLKADVKDIELEPFTPYAEKYAGYGIEKGKLSFNVDYKIENRKLKAENRLILDQLTFGEKVESPTATKLPVLLAVALLKDRNGVIDLNLPIGGSLDDPEFSVGGVILHVLVNLIAKAATSPFALLGAAFGGGGEELSYVEFQPGLSALDDAAIDKLNKIGKALNDRPGLSLDISGRADPVADREGLKRYLLERAVKAQKVKELVKKGEPAPSLDKVTVEPSEYEQYLTRAYREAKFPKPRNFIGLVKDIPVPEMEKLIITNTEITDDDLLQLASERAAAAQEYLINTEHVPADRIFLVAPKIEAGEGGEKGGGSRVDFALK